MEIVQTCLLELQERVEQESGRGDRERTESAEALAMHLELAGRKRRPCRVAGAGERVRRLRAAIRVAIVEVEEEKRLAAGWLEGRRAETDDRPPVARGDGVYLI